MSGLTRDSPAKGSPTTEVRRPWRWLAAGCRFVVAGVFLAAAVPKVTDLGQFESRLLMHSQLGHWLPPATVTAIAYTLPWLELICGFCLFVGHAPREMGILAIILLACFLVYSLVIPADRDCGCFLYAPEGQSQWGMWHPILNGVLLLSAIPIVWQRRRKPINSC
jgi:uncharacterized membrane protein YphA (DoxX/SURF4 family)